MLLALAQCVVNGRNIVPPAIESIFDRVRPRAEKRAGVTNFTKITQKLST